MTKHLHYCLAPAKLNLFLHVVGRRDDGYHLLESVFQLIDWCDVLHFDLRLDDVVQRTTVLDGVLADHDLSVRAARLLQAAGRAKLGRAICGVDIAIDKKLPMGGGLGGGSSDAATTLMALNHLWKLGFSRVQLMELGLQLGADVPFFLLGQNAFVEGVGEVLTPIITPDQWFVVIIPSISITTSVIFRAKGLTRDTNPVKISDFSTVLNNFGKNDLQMVAQNLFPEVSEVVMWLSQFGQARMSGSGSCVFCAVASELDADAVLQQVPDRWRAQKARSLAQHPLAGI